MTSGHVMGRLKLMRFGKIISYKESEHPNARIAHDKTSQPKVVKRGYKKRLHNDATQRETMNEDERGEVMMNG
jgi:hypothetical protein